MSSRELDPMILMRPFQLEACFDSLNLEDWGAPLGGLLPHRA